MALRMRLLECSDLHIDCYGLLPFLISVCTNLCTKVGTCRGAGSRGRVIICALVCSLGWYVGHAHLAGGICNARKIRRSSVARFALFAFANCGRWPSVVLFRFLDPSRY